MARRAPSESDHEHFVDREGNIMLEQNEGNQFHRHRNGREQEGSYSLVEGREALQSGC